MITLINLTFKQWLRRAIYRMGAGSVVGWFMQRRRSAPVHETAEYWNQELSGRMSTPNLNGRVSNALRDTTAAVLIRLCGPEPQAVLDIGCGFGDLAHALADQGMRRYVGVDLSDFVIKRANEQRTTWSNLRHCDLSFQHADLRAFSPNNGDVFDLIVFNEVLKYIGVDETVEQLRRYQQWLSPTGLLCVNFSDDSKSRAILRALDAKFEWVYGVIYQQQPNDMRFKLSADNATPPYLLGLFRRLATASQIDPNDPTILD